MLIVVPAIHFTVCFNHLAVSTFLRILPAVHSRRAVAQRYARLPAVIALDWPTLRVPRKVIPRTPHETQTIDDHRTASSPAAAVTQLLQFSRLSPEYLCSRNLPPHQLRSNRRLVDRSSAAAAVLSNRLSHSDPRYTQLFQQLLEPGCEHCSQTNYYFCRGTVHNLRTYSFMLQLPSLNLTIFGCPKLAVCLLKRESRLR